MDRIDTLLDKQSKPQVTTQAGQHRSSTEAMAAMFVNEVFKQLRSIFPAWSAAIPTELVMAEAKRQWLLGLVESRISSWEQINAGLAKCRAHNSPFLPSIGQFVEWCKVSLQDAIGLPSESEALSALTRELGKAKELRQWANHHPSVFMAYSQRQSYDWKNYSYRDLKMAFSETWAEIKKSASDGFDFNLVLPKPSDVSAPHTEKPVDREVAAKKSAELLSLFGLDAEKTYHDNGQAKAALEKARQLLNKN